jgi:hypothetical protein
MLSKEKGWSEVMHGTGIRKGVVVKEDQEEIGREQLRKTLNKVKEIICE